MASYPGHAFLVALRKDGRSRALHLFPDHSIEGDVRALECSHEDATVERTYRQLTLGREGEQVLQGSHRRLAGLERLAHQHGGVDRHVGVGEPDDL